MRVALYARISTNDRNQDPETQLLALRDFARAQGWDVHAEYVDRAPANDPGHRTAWRALLDDAAKKRFRTVVVFRLDRAFRSVKHMHDTLSVWEAEQVDFRSLTEGFDTGTPLGRLLLNLLASLAEFELEVLRDRVHAGMARARRQGKRIGRPPIIERPEVARLWPTVELRILNGEISLREAAKLLRIGKTTVRRLLEKD